ncbi:META domain-containing protein [Rubrivirga sp. IMCC45206]|uniref:META domain-containing protein n=1 Tax=Rubrivirga sp. IMCC45206 TaxID=3391614 RepID=UPI00399020D8
MPLSPALCLLALTSSTLVGFALAACSPSPSDGPVPVSGDPAPVTVPDDPPFQNTQWRLASLGGEAPVEGVRPVLVFSEAPAERDLWDRPYPAELAGWSLLRGESGVGRLHAPYRLDGDTLRVRAPYEYTRLSTDAEIAQARALAASLLAAPRVVRDGRRLAFVRGADTLATFRADPPREPGPLDDTAWDLVTLDGAPALDATVATLRFSSDPLGPGPEDGFDQFGGYSGCNWFGGGYRLAALGPERWRLTTGGPVMSTQRGCVDPIGQQETAYYAALEAVRTVARDGDRLALADSAGAVRLVFRAHPERSVDAAALRRGRWRLASSDSPYAPSPLPSVEVAFRDSTVEATVACRTFRGTFALDGAAFQIRELAADDTGCADGVPETAYWSPFGGGEIEVSDTRLVLFDENGQPSTFTR